MRFKKNVNLGESTLRHVIRTMAASAVLVGNFTNKSERVTILTRMSLANLQADVIAANSGYKTLPVSNNTIV